MEIENLLNEITMSILKSHTTKQDANIFKFLNVYCVRCIFFANNMKEFPVLHTD